jgi:hypothetical protein
VTPIERARLKLSQIDRSSDPRQVERHAHQIARLLTPDQLADLLSAEMHGQDTAQQTLQDCVTRVGTVTRAMELRRYQE